MRAIAFEFGNGMLFVGSTGTGREYTSYMRGRCVGSFADDDDDDDEDDGDDDDDNDGDDNDDDDVNDDNNDDDDDDNDDATSSSSLPAWLASTVAAAPAMGGCLPWRPPKSDANPGTTL